MDNIDYAFVKGGYDHISFDDHHEVILTRLEGPAEQNHIPVLTEHQLRDALRYVANHHPEILRAALVEVAERESGVFYL